MARPLAALERFFERLFERPAARLFNTRLQPVQLQRRLERAMEAERRHGADRTYVPNRFRVRLHPSDLAAFQGYQATLEAELAEALMARARSRGYTMVERPRVTLEAAGRVPEGDLEVDAELLDPLLMRPAPAGFRRVRDEEQAGDAGTAAGPPRLEQTAVFQLPTAAAPQVGLLVRPPSGAPRRVPLEAGGVRIGRAADNDIVLADEKVSRYHGQLSSRQGTLVYTDLGSTNGSYVAGAPVTEMAVGPGDVLQLGDSTITVELER